MDFIAIDFETANQKQAPCELAVVLVENNVITKEYCTLIDPKESFNIHTVNIHGITKQTVADAPIFPSVWEEIKEYFHRFPVVAHNVHFDKRVLEKTLKRYKLSIPPVVYYDTMALYKHNYAQYDKLTLTSMCKELGISLENHHSALCDAKATAQAMICMLQNDDNDIFPTALGEKIDLSDYSEPHFCEKYEKYENKREPILMQPSTTLDISESICFENSIFVLTGIIVGHVRGNLIADIVARGGKVASGVSSKTTYLITGLQDISVVNDKENAKSTSLIKAENLRDTGKKISILGADILLAALYG